MRKLVSLTLALFLVSASAASAQSIAYNFDSHADFSKYKTYKWIRIKNADHLDPTTEKQFTAALDAALTRKGLSRTDADTADLYVGYQTAISMQKHYSTYKDEEYPADWADGWSGRMVSKRKSMYTIYIGQLAIDMYDPTTKNIVWRAVADKAIDMKAKPEQRRGNLLVIAKMLLDLYPPTGI